MVLLSLQPLTLLAVLAVFCVSLFKAILALPRFERCRFSFALILRFLLFTLATESVEIVSIIVLEKILFIFAAVCSLFPETAACQHK